MQHGCDLSEAKDQADCERHLELEREIAHRHALAARLEANRHRKARLFDAMELAALRDLVNAEYEPSMAWHSENDAAKVALAMGHTDSRMTFAITGSLLRRQKRSGISASVRNE
jgi:hypothetical protein